MLAGNHLSTYQAFDLWQITCFLQRISDLRADGVIINDEVVKQNGKRFKRYWIEQPTPQTVEGV